LTTAIKTEISISEALEKTVDYIKSTVLEKNNIGLLREFVCQILQHCESFKPTTYYINMFHVRACYQWMFEIIPPKTKTKIENLKKLYPKCNFVWQRNVGYKSIKSIVLWEIPNQPIQKISISENKRMKQNKKKMAMEKEMIDKESIWNKINSL
jgi:hypothetical protein